MNACIRQGVCPDWVRSIRRVITRNSSSWIPQPSLCPKMQIHVICKIQRHVKKIQIHTKEKSGVELTPEALPQISVWQKKRNSCSENENIRLARSGFEQLRFICRVITRAPITLSLPPISSISLSKKEKGFPTKVQRRKRKITHVVHTNNRLWSENAC